MTRLTEAQARDRLIRVLADRPYLFNNRDVPSYLYLTKEEENADEFIFTVSVIPMSIPENKVTPKIADKYADMPWRVDRKTGGADINWGMPPDLL